MRKIVLFIGLQLLFLINLYANTDSTGIKYINGKLFVLHKVEKGQGLYGIARRYGSTVEKVKEANPGIKTSITVGQTLMVPYGKPGASAKKQPDKKTPEAGTKKTTKARQPVKKEEKEKDDDDNGGGNAGEDGKEPVYHVVTKKETLYSVAVNHNTTMQKIRDWNNLKKDALKVGQKLIVGYGDKKEVKPGTTKTNPGKGTKTTKTTKTSKTAGKTTEHKTNSNAPKKEISENGMGSWVDDGSIKSEISLAMHKTAPVGTIVKVVNPMNKKFKYVKVIGTLPDIEENQNILIKIAKNTADELDIRDKVFRVELDYSVEAEK